MSATKLSKKELGRFQSCPVKCPLLQEKIQNLGDFFSVLSTTITTEDPYWFRGHADVEWSLTPSALRYKNKGQRENALSLLSEFKRVAEIKIDRPPNPDEELKWLQLAQHYGLPTRLLDWTEVATIGLYFACLKPDKDGVIFVMNPVTLNKLNDPKKPRILDHHLDASVIKPYLKLKGQPSNRGRRTVAINPVWNSHRIMLQKGVFTLHGSRCFYLDQVQAPSLVAVPILKEVKTALRNELQMVGLDEMTIFPEPEHACRHLKRKSNLEE